MSRIGNKINSGYVATQSTQLDYIKEIIEFTGPTNILDSCAGTGAALVQLAQARGEHHVTTYGVEIDQVRGEIAETMLDKCIIAPIESMMISNNAFGMVFVNPPYDVTLRGITGKVERKEAIELERATRYLVPGGLMIYIIPIYRMAEERIARHLATYFDHPAVARFTDENFDEYRQVVFFGYKKNTAYKALDEHFYEQLLNIVELKEELPTLADMAHDAVTKGFKWSIPDTSSIPIKTFATRLVNKSVISEAMKNSEGLTKFLSTAKPRSVDIQGKKAPLPLASGQIAMLMSAGAINGMIGEGDDLHILRGAEIVSNVEEKEETETGWVTKVRTKRDIAVKIISPSGDVIKLTESKINTELKEEGN